MNAPTPSRWDELFNIALSIIDQANKDFELVGRWTFGGGTALMLQIGHRESHDVDLFVDDPQILSLLNPETQEFDLAMVPSSYVSDGAQALKITFDGVGEIDWICCGWLLEENATRREVCGREVWLETPAEIIAKKIRYRGWNLQPRDMFDIAAVRQAMGGDYVAKALSDYRGEAAAALKIAQQMSPDLASKVLQALNARPGFEEIQARAQEDAIALLKRVIED